MFRVDRRGVERACRQAGLRWTAADGGTYTNQMPARVLVYSASSRRFYRIAVGYLYPLHPYYPANPDTVFNVRGPDAGPAFDSLRRGWAVRAVPPPGYALPGEGVRRVTGQYSYENRNRPTHAGIDLGYGLGSPLYAIEAGAAVARYNSILGYHVEQVLADGSGFAVLYCHLVEGSLPGGRTVGQSWTAGKGEYVGRAGVTGLTTGPHLHLELRPAAAAGLWVPRDRRGWVFNPRSSLVDYFLEADGNPLRPLSR